MKRPIFLTVFALIISAGIMAQSNNKTQNQIQNRTQMQTGDQSQLKTHKKNQLRTYDQKRTLDQLRKRDQIRLQDPSPTMSQTGIQNAQLHTRNVSQARRIPPNNGARNSAMYRKMRMSTVLRARHR